MYKFLSIALLAMAGLFVLSGTADAGWRRGRCYYYPAPAAVAPTPAPVPAPPPASEAQTYRSYSYEPAAPTYRSYSAPSRGYRGGDPSNNFNAGRKIHGL